MASSPPIDHPPDTTRSPNAPKGASPNTNLSNTPRYLKSIRPNADIRDLFDILLELSSLELDRLEQEPSTTIELRAITQTSSTKLFPAFDEDVIRKAFETESDYFSTHLFPTDILKITYESAIYIRKTSQEQISPENKAQLNPLIIAIEQRYAGSIDEAKDIMNSLDGNIWIFHANEQYYLDRQKKEGFRELSTLVQNCFDHHKQLRGLFDREYISQVAGSRDEALKPDYSEYVKDFGSLKLADETTIEQQVTQSASGPVATTAEVQEALEKAQDATTAPMKTASAIDQEYNREKNLKDEDLEKIPDDAGAFNIAVSECASTTAKLVLTSLMSAYTQGPEGQSLVAFESLDEELRLALVRNLAPQIENMIASLTASEFITLTNNRPGASNIRLRLLRQAHQFALGYPPLRMLMQTAIDVSYARLNNVKEVQQELANQVQNTTHEQAAANLEKISQSEWDLGEQVSNIDTIANTLSMLSLRSVNPDLFRTQFANRLMALIGPDADETKIKIAIDNFERMLASVTIADPLLSSDFITYLDANKLKAFLGDIIPDEVFARRKNEIQSLLKQYWTVYRADLNRSNASLQQISELSAPHIPLDEKQVNNTIYRATFVRERFMQSDLSPEEVVGVVAGNKNAKNFEGEKLSAAKQVEEFVKQSFWENADIEQRRRYLNELGILEIKQAQKINDLLQLTVIFEQSQQELDYFLFFQVEQAIAQEQAIIQLHHRQLFVSASIEALQTQQQVAQLQALLQAERFFIPDEMMSDVHSGETASGGIPSFPNYAYSPQGVNSSLAQSGQMGGLLQGQQAEMLKNLAAMGVSTALTTGAGIPKPIADFFSKILVEESQKKIRYLLEALKAAAAAAALALLGLIAFIGKILTALGAVGGAVTLGGAGLAVGGGAVGGLIGLIGGGLAGLLAGGAAGTAASSAVATQAAQAGASNLGSTLSGLFKNAANQASLFGRSLFGKQAAGAGASGAGGAGAAAAGTTTATAVANWATFGTIGVTGVATVFVMTVIQSAFLIPLSGERTFRPDQSRFVTIKKTASIVESPDCDGKNVCSLPTFPITVEYRVEIEPKDNFSITITNLQDEASVYYNKKKYKDDGLPVPTNTTFPIRTAENLGVTLPIVLSQTDEDPDNDRTQFVYRIVYGDNFNHASVKNKIKIQFDYIDSTEQGSDFASAIATVGFGEYPPTQLCWPNTGEIYQYPFQVGAPTHENTDAYDITPTNSSHSRAIYAPYDGLIKRFDDLSGYGIHLSLTLNFEGEEYILYIAHLSSAIINKGDTSVKNVSRGEYIGVVGSTGNSTGPHVHFEKRSASSGSLSLTQLMTNNTRILSLFETVYSCADE